MTDEEQFEVLKNDAIKDLEKFINVIRGINFNDLKDLNKRFPLMEAYKDSIVSNSKYRSFIHGKQS